VQPRSSKRTPTCSKEHPYDNKARAAMITKPAETRETLNISNQTAGDDKKRAKNED
jgi:hypothetical protein